MLREWGQGNDNEPAVEFGLIIGFSNTFQILDGTTHQVHAQVNVLHLPPSEHQGDFQFVSLMQKLFRTANLGHIIMFFDSRTKLCLFDSFGSLFFVPLVFAQFVLVFAKLKNPADRGVGGGCDSTKSRKCDFAIFSALGRHNAEHLSIRTDYTDFTSPYLVVLPNVITVMIPFLIFSTWFLYHVVICG